MWVNLVIDTAFGWALQPHSVEYLKHEFAIALYWLQENLTVELNSQVLHLSLCWHWPLMQTVMCSRICHWMRCMLKYVLTVTFCMYPDSIFHENISMGSNLYLFILVSVSMVLSIKPTLFTIKNGREVCGGATSQLVRVVGCPVQWIQHWQLKLETLSTSTTAGSFHYHWTTQCLYKTRTRKGLVHFLFMPGIVCIHNSSPLTSR